ncbi:MAG: STAS domain-containing protein [Betaproteobacteria bacterium]
MIRITTAVSGGTLNVAGDLIGESAWFLERECVRRLDTQPELSLDLSDLKRVDDAGIEALRRLKKRGARITRCSRVISDLIGGSGPDRCARGDQE